MFNLKSVAPIVAMLTVAACTTDAGPQPMQVDLHAMQRHAAKMLVTFNEVLMRVHATDINPPVITTADGNATSIAAHVPAGPARILEVSAWDTTVTPNQVYYWGETTVDLKINQSVAVDLSIYPAGLLTGTAYVGGAVGPQVRVNVQAASTDPNGAIVELLLDGNNTFVQPLPVGSYTLTGVATVGGQTMLLDQPGVFTISQGQTITIRPHFVGPPGQCDSPIDNDGDGYFCSTDPNNPGANADCDDNNANVWKSCNTCVDTDGDHWFVGCDTYDTIFGPDCNDNDPYNWLSCATCNDTDGDGWRSVSCDSYDPNRPHADCNDNDTNNWNSCATCLDTDGDNVFSGCDRYISDAGPDCDPNNGAVWISCSTCVDLDGDSHFAGCDSYTNNPAVQYDCNDADAHNWSSCFLCADRDGDGYYSGCDMYDSSMQQDCDDRTALCTVDDNTCPPCVAQAFSLGLAANDGYATLTWNPNALANAVSYNVYLGTSSSVSNAGGTYTQVLRDARPPVILRGLPNGAPTWVYLTGSNGYAETPLNTTPMETTPQALFRNIVAIDAGVSHSVALKADGSVWTWGDNTYGQTGTGQASTVPLRVTSLPPIARVAAGTFHTLALDTNGNIWAWGSNQYYQCGQATASNITTPMRISGPANKYNAISAGDRHSLALAGTSAWAWGDNTFSQLGVTATAHSAVPLQVPGTFHRVAAGYQHSLAADPNNNVYAWGTSSAGALGVAGPTLATPTLIGDVLAGIAAGDDHSMGIGNGQVNVFGNNQYLQDQNATPTANAISPTPVSLTARFVVTRDHSAAIDPTGQLSVWGNNDKGQVGQPPTGNVSSPYYVPFTGANNAQVLAAAVGGHHTLALLADGTVWAWGDNSLGQLGIGPQSGSFVATRIGAAQTVAAGDAYSAMLRNDGKAFVWGDASHGQTASQTPMALTPLPSLVNLPTPLAHLAGGSTHLAALDVTGQVYTWGDNTYGEAGIGTTTSSTLPTPVPGMGNMKFVAAGSHFTLASDGNFVWAWGLNNVGQLGIGVTTNMVFPKQVAGNFQPCGGIVALAAGYQHAVAACQNGNVYTWGSNANNQLGPTSATSATVPTLITPQPGWAQPVAVSAGYAHTVLVDTNYGAWFWGDNSNGEFGTGNAGAATGTPAAGSSMSLAVAGKSVSYISYYLPPFVGGSVANIEGVGINTDGQMGNGSTVSPQTTAVNITLAGNGCNTTTNSVAAPVNGAHGVATLNNGAGVMAWGKNNSGQAGNANMGGDLLTPAAIDFGHTFKDVRAGGRFVAALRDDGTVFTWGANDAGQLGIGYPAAFACGGSLNAASGSACATGTPVTLGSGATASQIAVGTNHMLALDASGHLFAWGDNSRNQILGAVGPDGLSDVPGLLGLAQPVNSIAAGNGFSVAVFTGNSNYIVNTWGANDRGQCGTGSVSSPLGITQNTVPSQPFGPVPQVFAGDCAAFAAVSGQVFAWGCNDVGQTGTGLTGDVSTAAPVVGLSTVVTLCAGHDFAMALDTNGLVFSWGGDSNAQLGDGGGAPRNTPARVAVPPMVDIACGPQFALAVDTSGQVWAWGANGTNQLGQGGTAGNLPAPVPGLFAPAVPNTGSTAATHVVAAGGGVGLGAANGFTVVNTGSGFLTFGANDSGQLGASPQPSGSRVAPGYVPGL